MRSLPTISFNRNSTWTSPLAFGHAVESDALKRKREEVQISELDLHLCEQACALKRRRVEGIQFCLEALAFGSSSAGQPEGKEICIREVMNAAGRARESPSLDMKVGKLAKKLLLIDHPSYVFPKKTIWACGQIVEANAWTASQRGYIERALASI